MTEVLHEPEELIVSPSELEIETVEAVEASEPEVKEESVSSKSEHTDKPVDGLVELAISLGWDESKSKLPGGKDARTFIVDYGKIQKNKNKALEQSISALQQTLIETETEKLMAYQQNIDTAIGDMIKNGTINTESYEQLLKEKKLVNDQIAKVTNKIQRAVVTEDTILVRDFGFKNRELLLDDSVNKWAQQRIDYLFALNTDMSVPEILDQVQGELNTKCGIKAEAIREEAPSKTISSTPVGKKVVKTPTEKDLWPEHLDLYENFYKRNGKITNVSDFVKHMRASAKASGKEFKLKGE